VCSRIRARERSSKRTKPLRKLVGSCLSRSLVDRSSSSSSLALARTWLLHSVCVFVPSCSRWLLRNLTDESRSVGWLVGWLVGVAIVTMAFARSVVGGLRLLARTSPPRLVRAFHTSRVLRAGGAALSTVRATRTPTHTYDDPPTIVLTRSRRSTAIPTATTREFRSTLRPRTTKWYAARPALRLASRLLSLVIHTGQEDHLQVPAQLQKVCRHSVAGPCAAPVWRLVRRAHASSRAHAHTAHTPPRPRPRRRLC